MNGIYEKIEITEANIEEMSQLAEDVMHQLYMNYQDYDADGRDILINITVRRRTMRRIFIR